MSRRPRLQDWVQPEVQEVDVQRWWRGVQAARRPRAGVVRTWGPALATMAAAIVVVTARLWPAPSPSLGFADGRALRSLSADDAPAHVVLSDSSELTLRPGARLALLELGPREIRWGLEAGAVEFDVHEPGARRWVIDAGRARLEVVGTRFVVRRVGPGTRVRVSRGAVLVRPEGPDREVALLRAGEAWSSVPAPSVKIATRPAIAPLPPRPRPRRAPTPAPRPARAVAAAAPPPVVRGPAPTPRTSPDVTWARVDAARRRGEPEVAVSLLKDLLREHPSDARAGTAAFTLGRILLGPLDRPSEAAAAFDRALELGAPDALTEDVLARRVEARARASDEAGARAAARDYHERYPSGRYAARVREWSSR